MCWQGLYSTEVLETGNLAWPKKFVHPTHQLARGPMCPPSMKAQKYKPPETGKADDSSLSARAAQTVKMLANTQPQTSTAGPPYRRPKP